MRDTEALPFYSRRYFFIYMGAAAIVRKQHGTQNGTYAKITEEVVSYLWRNDEYI